MSVRKSAFGRTQLFLPTPSVLMREVKCMGGITRRDSASVFHVLPDLLRPGTHSACWHCCESVGDAPMPIPRIFDTTENIYHVYGCVCCPGCAKAYILEHTSFDRGKHLDVLVHMLRSVYGMTGPILETPPRPSLKRFGGYFDPRNPPRAACRLVEPPFVSYCMIAEERMAEQELPIQDAEDLEEPPPPGLYMDFLREERKRAASPVAGPLARFVKRKA